MNLEFIKYKGDEISNKETFLKLPTDLQNLLKEINGFTAFDGGLHLRGIVNIPEWHSLEKVWFGDFALYEMFSSLKESDIPFGQDCLGDQYILRKKKFGT